MSESTTGPAPGTAGTAGTTTATTTTTAVSDAQLREAAEARTRAEEERDLALREAADNKRQLDRFRAIEAARPVAAAKLAESELPTVAQQRVLASVEQRVPLTEAGALDETALTTLIEAEVKAETAYLAQLAESDGAGRVRGLGTKPAGTGQQPAAATFASVLPPVNEVLREAYTARGMTPEAATLAARGRPF